jgi:hypothetical protein
VSRAQKTPQDFIQPGALVWYESSPGRRFSAVVDEEPWLLGGHTWVTRLRELPPEYREGKRSTVPAAACDRLAPRTEPAPGKAGSE